MKKIIFLFFTFSYIFVQPTPNSGASALIDFQSEWRLKFGSAFNYSGTILELLTTQLDQSKVSSNRQLLKTISSDLHNSSCDLIKFGSYLKNNSSNLSLWVVSLSSLYISYKVIKNSYYISRVILSISNSLANNLVIEPANFVYKKLRPKCSGPKSPKLPSPESELFLERAQIMELQR